MNEGKRSKFGQEKDLLLKRRFKLQERKIIKEESESKKSAELSSSKDSPVK